MKDLFDAEAPGTLASAATAIATTQRDLVLLFSAGDALSISMCANALSQLRRIALEEHTLVVVQRYEHCDALSKVSNMSRHRCLWSSGVLERAPADSVSLRKFWDGRFRFYPTKKRYVASLVRAGFGVLQADTDIIFRRNPFPQLRAVVNASLIVQKDRPFANAGLLYARPGSAAAQALLDRLAWQLAMLQHRPSIVRRIAPFARPPYYANSDDQTALNDAIVVSVTQNDSFSLLSVAKYEARNAYHESNVSWTDLPQYHLWHAGVSRTWQLARRLRVNDWSITAFPLPHAPSDGAARDHVALAPLWLFSHMSRRDTHYLTHFAAMRGFAAKRRAMRELGAWGGD